MRRDKSNTWLTGPEQPDDWASSADAIVVERSRTTMLLGDVLSYQFGEKKGLRVLDLGGGDGSITERLQERFPDHTFTLLDGSPDMLERAKRRLHGKGVIFIQQTFEEYVDVVPQDQTYDFIFSSNAIHHLDFIGKSQVYAKVLRELSFGVCSSTSTSSCRPAKRVSGGSSTCGETG